MLAPLTMKPSGRNVNAVSSASPVPSACRFTSRSTRLRSRDSGTIGAVARRSTANHATASSNAPAARDTVTGEAHG